MPEDKIEIFITPEGFVELPWWTKEAQEILQTVGPSAPGYEEVNPNPWCG